MQMSNKVRKIKAALEMAEAGRKQDRLELSICVLALTVIAVNNPRKSAEELSREARNALKDVGAWWSRSGAEEERFH